MTDVMPRSRPVRAAVVAVACALPCCALAPPIVEAATLPPTLVALEQKWAELKITSLRFSSRTSIHLAHGGRDARCLANLLGEGSQSGEYTTAPAAARVSLEMFGIKLKLRQVGNAVYMYLRPLARYDRGRPWVRLGKRGLAELLAAEGNHVTSAPKPEPLRPKIAEPRFALLDKLLAGAREIREVGSGTVAGQAVTRFLAVLEPSELEAPSPSGSSARRAAETLSATLELALATSGLPVRTRITISNAAVSSATTVEIPAVNFPLVIAAPPVAKTTTFQHFRWLKRHGRLKSLTDPKPSRSPLAGCIKG